MFRPKANVRNEWFDPIEDTNQVSGFKSPAEDYSKDRLSLDDLVVRDPTNTYFWRCRNDEMAALGIYKNELLVVDTSEKPTGGAIVIACIDGVWHCRQLVVNGKQVFFTAGQEGDFIRFNPDEGMLIRGVVTWSFRQRHGSSSRL